METYSFFEIAFLPPTDIFGFVVRFFWGICCILNMQKDWNERKLICFIFGFVGCLSGFILLFIYVSVKKKDWGILFGHLTTKQRLERLKTFIISSLFVFGILAYFIYAYENYDDRSDGEKALDSYCAAQGLGGCSDTAREIKSITDR